MAIPSFLYPPKIMLLHQIRRQGVQATLHHIWQGCGYVPSNYRFFSLGSADRSFLYTKLFWHGCVFLSYTLPLFWLYARFDLFAFSRADGYVWGFWFGITTLLVYRFIPIYCDAYARQKIVIKAYYAGYKYIGGINKFDFNTLTFETKDGKETFIKPFWPHERDIVAKFLSDAQVGHPVYIEKTGFTGLLLNLRSDWKALGQTAD